MNSNDSSNTWGPLPGWLSASITGSHPAVPLRRDPQRPRTLSVVPMVDMPSMPSMATMGTVKRGSPPPDLARVASSFALLGALMLALVLSWSLGG